MPLSTKQKVAIGGVAIGGVAIAAYVYEKNKKEQAATAAAAAASSQAAYGYASGYGYNYAYGYGPDYYYGPAGYGYGSGSYGYGTYGGGGSEVYPNGYMTYGYGDNYYGYGETTPASSQSGSGTASGTTTSSPSGTSTTTASKPITVAPTGFRVVSVTNGDDVNLAWNALTPPSGEGPLTGYMIAYGPTSGSQQYKQQVGGQTTAATVPGVGAGSAGKHYFELWALPAASGGPHAGPIEATTTKTK